MDVHVRRVVPVSLRLRGVDVLTAQEDGAARFPDPELLDRAGELNRVLFSQDRDLLREATQRQRQGRPFSGVIYARGKTERQVCSGSSTGYVAKLAVKDPLQLT